MTRGTLTVAAFSALLWAGVAFAVDPGTPTGPTPQQKCDRLRVTAWKTYQSCVERIVARDAGGLPISDEFSEFARCRHKYFTKWARFQEKVGLSDTTCNGSRFTDNSDGTVTDNMNGLVWEKKTNPDGTQNYADPHDADNTYTWSTGAPYTGNGTVFTDFLMTLNSRGFADASDWRLPSLAELQTIEQDIACKGPGGGLNCGCDKSPCINFALWPMQSNWYWTITTYVPNPKNAWFVDFSIGLPDSNNSKMDPSGNFYAIAVRGGL